MFRLIKRKHMLTDHYAAKDWLKFNESKTFRSQRTLNNNHVVYLRNQMKKGLFLDGDIAFAQLSYNGNEQILVNGQHQLEALLVLRNFSINILYRMYECDTPEDLSALFRQFDANRIRTLASCVRVEGNALGIEWPPRIQSLVVSGGIMIEKKAHRSKDDKVKLLKKYESLGNLINEIIEHPPRIRAIAKADMIRHIKRKAVIAAMLLTFDKNPTDAKQFWIEVRDGVGIGMASPAYKLRNWLMKMSLFRRNAGAGINLATDQEFLGRCIRAWNAYRNGTSTDLRYYPEKPVPELI